jgi:hypothetical protein
MNEPMAHDKGLQDTVTSLCPECLEVIPGIVREHEGDVVMEKTCPDHGSFTTPISTDPSTYTKLRVAPERLHIPAGPGLVSTGGALTTADYAPPMISTPAWPSSKSYRTVTFNAPSVWQIRSRSGNA